MKKFAVLSLLGISLLLSGCGEVAESLGLGRNPPDEFAVVDRPPLALPPDFNLRPPRPGAPRPQEVNTSQQASTMLFGTGAASGQVGRNAFLANVSPDDAFRSESEKAILAAAGSSRADPNIRDLVDREAAEKVVTTRHLVDELLWWKNTQPPATTVDAIAEAQRIREAKDKGAPINQGATPIIERQKVDGSGFERHTPLIMGVLVALLACQGAARAAVFYPETFTLANGLQFVVVTNRLSPAVAQMVWYKVGSADEAPGKSGLAHYLEHLMFRGTEKVPAGTFSPLIAAQGGRDNAMTSYDYTAYHEIVAADRLGLVMQLEADRMQNLRITPETATPELSVVLNERDERTDNSPQGLFAERIRAALYPNHPYGIPVIGWRKELQRMTPEAAMTFYRQHYAPNNAVVVISGNIELPEVMRLAAATYGQIPRHDISPRTPLSAPSLPQGTRLTMSDSRVQQPQLSQYTVVPSYTTQNGNEAYALEVLSEALDSGEVGKLYRQLVVQQKIASGVGVYYDPQARGPANFTISVTPQPGQAVEKLEQSLDDVLRQAAIDGLTATEVNAAKERLTRSATFARDSLMAPGYAFGVALTTGGKIEDVESWPDRIAAVTTEEVNTALRQLLVNKHRLTGVLLPEVNNSSDVLPTAAVVPPGVNIE